MTCFNSSFLKFSKALSANNTSVWFNENRKTYETEVKKPFVNFVEEMIRRIQKYEPDVQISASDAIMRINRDIRFSSDKTPYNTHVSAIISSCGKKDKSCPGLYFQLSYKYLEIYGGAYMLEKDALQNMRHYISAHLKDFSKVCNDANFKEKFGSMLGEPNKRIPPEFQKVFETEPRIANKQFYYKAKLKSGIITSDELPDVFMQYYLAGKPVNDFLKKGLGMG